MKSFIELRAGNILGIVDSYGAVSSVFTERVECHDSYFPVNSHCRWRWNFNEGIYWFLAESRPNAEELDAVMRHIEKKYGIKFWENGFHDMDYFIKKLNKERWRKKIRFFVDK